MMSSYETSYWELHCEMQDGEGDGTVPASSGASPAARGASNVKQQFRLTGFGHEKSYQNAAAQSETLFSAMLDASEPDTMFLLLLENTPELVPPSDRGPFRDRLSHLLARAYARWLSSPNDRLQFVILGLSCGNTFDDHQDQ